MTRQLLLPILPVLPILLVGALGFASPAAAADRIWTFAVTLDGRSIGEHTFRVSQDGDETVVDSRASFDVRILGLSIYSYEHRAKERWKDGCLSAFESHTDDNGTLTNVKGALEGDGFVVVRGRERAILPVCTMTFAYWNPDMRRQRRLLNPQTGDYLDVGFGAPQPAPVDERDRKIDATLSVLRGKDLEIALWYAADDGRWVALDSRTSRGSLLMYRISSSPEADRTL